MEDSIIILSNASDSLDNLHTNSQIATSQVLRMLVPFRGRDELGGQ